jgi:hypothetical protein
VSIQPPPSSPSPPAINDLVTSLLTKQMGIVVGVRFVNHQKLLTRRQGIAYRVYGRKRREVRCSVLWPDGSVEEYLSCWLEPVPEPPPAQPSSKCSEGSSPILPDPSDSPGSLRFSRIPPIP